MPKRTRAEYLALSGKNKPLDVAPIDTTTVDIKSIEQPQEKPAKFKRTMAEYDALVKSEQEPEGGYGDLIKLNAEQGVGSLKQNVAGFMSSYGQPWMTSVPGQPGMLPQNDFGKEVLQKSASQKSVELAKESEVTGQKIAAIDKGYIGEVLGALGTSLGPGVAGVLGAVLAGPQGAMVASSITESAQEQGSVQSELINNYGMSPEDAYKSSLWVFAANLPLNYLTDKWMMKVFPDEAFVKQLKGAGGKKAIAKLIAKRFGASAIQEPVQEVTQETISKLGTTGDPSSPFSGELLSPREALHTAAVALPFGVLSGTAATAPHVSKALDEKSIEAVPGGKKLTLQETPEVSPVEQKEVEDPVALEQWAQDTYDEAEAEAAAGNQESANELYKYAAELREEAYNAKELKDLTPLERAALPSKGVPITKLTSMYIRGELTVDEFIEQMPDYAKGQAGAVTTELLKKIKKGIQERNKAKGKTKRANEKNKKANKKARDKLEKKRKANDGFLEESDIQLSDELAREAEAYKAIDKDESLVSEKDSDEYIYMQGVLATLSPEIMAEIQGDGNIANLKSSEFRDKRRTISDLVRRRRDSVIMNNMQRLGETMEIVRDKLKKDFAAEAEVVGEMSGTTKGSKEASIFGQLIQDPGKIDELTQGMSEEAISKMLEAVDAAHELMDRFKERRNILNKTFLGREFKGIEDTFYFPEVEKKKNILKNPIQKIEQVSRPLNYRRGKDTGSAKLRSPRELHRSGKVKDPDWREWDYWKVMEDYVADTARKIAYQPVTSASAAINEGLESDAVAAKNEAKSIRKNAKNIAKENEGIDNAELTKTLDEMEAQAKQFDSRASGLRNAAEASNAVMQASYNNVSFGTVNKFIERHMSTVEDEAGNRDKSARAWVVTNKTAAAGKRMFNAAKYKLNVPFIILRQWTSSGQAWGFEGVSLWDIAVSFAETSASISFDAANVGAKIGTGAANFVTRGKAGPAPNITTEATRRNKGTYTGTIKGGKQGGMAREGEVGMRKAQLKSPGIKAKVGRGLRTLDDITNMPTQYVEELTGRFAAGVASRVADRMTYIDKSGNEVGLTPKMKNDYMSDVIAQMQSEYHHESRAEALRSPIANILLPAQSFALEVSQNLGRATNADRARLVVGMMTANILYQAMNNYGDTDDKKGMAKFTANLALSTLEGAIPWSSAITGKGPSGGQTYVASLIGDLGQAGMYMNKANKAETEEDANIYYGRAANEVIKNVIPGGGQIGRAVMAEVMLARNLIKPHEMTQARTLGWWTTDSGKAYLRRITGTQSEGDKADSGGRVQVNRPIGRTADRQPAKRY